MGREVDEVAEAAGLPSERLAWMLTNKWDGVEIGYGTVNELAALYVALHGSIDGHHEWFREPDAEGL